MTKIVKCWKLSELIETETESTLVSVLSWTWGNINYLLTTRHYILQSSSTERIYKLWHNRHLFYGTILELFLEKSADLFSDEILHRETFQLCQVLHTCHHLWSTDLVVKLQVEFRFPSTASSGNIYFYKKIKNLQYLFFFKRHIQNCQWGLKMFENFVKNVLTSGIPVIIVWRKLSYFIPENINESE